MITQSFDLFKRSSNIRISPQKAAVAHDPFFLQFTIYNQLTHATFFPNLSLLFPSFFNFICFLFQFYSAHTPGVVEPPGRESECSVLVLHPAALEQPVGRDDRFLSSFYVAAGSVVRLRGHGRRCHTHSGITFMLRAG